jgi:hypothetical protein
MFSRSLLRFLLIASTSVTVSACIGAYEKQPDRYNYVEGGKRSPVLNPQTVNPVTPRPTEEELYARVPPVASPAMAPAAVAMPPAGAAVPVNAPSAPAALEPSPLYYYEQQNAGVTASSLPQDEMVASDTAPAESTAPVEPEFDTFPELNTVPNRDPALEKSFDAAKDQAKSFTAEQQVAPVESKEVMPVEPMPAVAPVPDDVLEQSPVNAPSPSSELTETVAVEPSVSATPSEMTQEVAVDELLAGHAASEVVVPPVQAATIPPSPAIDYTQQPIPVPSAASDPYEQELQQEVAQPSTPVVVETPSPEAVPVFAPEGQQEMTVESITVEAPVVPVEENTVVVPQTPRVAAVPAPHRLYTASGAVELTPPTRFSDRASTLPPSRYSSRRQQLMKAHTARRAHSSTY